MLCMKSGMTESIKPDVNQDKENPATLAKPIPVMFSSIVRPSEIRFVVNRL